MLSMNPRIMEGAEEEDGEAPGDSSPLEEAFFSSFIAGSSPPPPSDTSYPYSVSTSSSPSTSLASSAATIPLAALISSPGACDGDTDY